MILSVDLWRGYKNYVDLSWSVVKFNISEVDKIPDDQQGVYTFVVKPGIANHPEYAVLLYVGQTKRTFRERFMEYLREPKKAKPRIRIKEMIDLWGSNNLWFCYAEIKNKTLIDKMEEQLIMAYVPPMNDQFPANLRPALQAW